MCVTKTAQFIKNILTIKLLLLKWIIIASWKQFQYIIFKKVLLLRYEIILFWHIFNAHNIRVNDIHDLICVINALFSNYLYYAH